MFKRVGCWLSMVLAGLAVVPAAVAGEALEPEVPKNVEIGMPKSIFQGVPAFIVTQLSAPFKQFMKAQTGIEGEVRQIADAMIVAQQLNDGKLQLAVFQGHEFAWAKAKYADLVPLAVVLPNQPPTQAFLIVRWDCEAKNIGSLEGQVLTLPPGLKDHSKLFLAKQRMDHMPNGAFSAQLIADSVKDAIFDVIEQKAQVTCVDSVGLE